MYVLEILFNSFDQHVLPRASAHQTYDGGTLSKFIIKYPTENYDLWWQQASHSVMSFGAAATGLDLNDLLSTFLHHGQQWSELKMPCENNEV